MGKSAIFGALTRRYVAVSNYPGTTVEVTRGRAALDGRVVDLIDTPGTNSLLPMSDDERVTRDIVNRRPCDTILQVGDAKNLSRALHLTLELAEAGRPLVVALNMLDEARTRGIRVDTALLTRRVGCPFVGTVAIRHQGLGRLAAALRSPSVPKARAVYPSFVEDALARLEPILPPAAGISKRALGLQILQGDETLLPWLIASLGPRDLDAIETIRRETSEASKRPLSVVIWEARNAVVEALLAQTLIGRTLEETGWGRRLAEWSSHPIKGLAVLAAVLYLTFWFVGLLGAGTFVDALETVVFGQWLNPVVIQGTDAVLPFPHEHDREVVSWSLEIPMSPAHSIPLGLGRDADVLQPSYVMTGEPTGLQKALRFLHDFLVGPYGAITVALTYGFAIVLPIVLTFFFLFSLLEDSGYLPRLAVMVHSTFRWMGLNGKAVLPLVLGLGCTTMATMTTRILETRKQRLIATLLMALAIPCSAQLGVLLAMMGQLSPTGVLVWAVSITGVMLGVGYVSARLMPGKTADFLLEVPPMRSPVWSNIFHKTAARIRWYLREVIPLFVLGTAVLFLFDKISVLGFLRRVGAPLIHGWLGLPPETADAFLVGFLRRDYGAVFLLDAATGPDAILNSAQVLTSMIVITLFVPCIATVFMIVKEFGLRVGILMVAFIFPFAFFVGGLVQRFIGWTGIPL